MHQQLAQLAQRIAPGSNLRHAWPLQGGISAGMVAFEIETANGQTSRLVKRQPNAALLARNPHAARNEFQLMQVLQAAGVAVPAALYVDESGALFEQPYLVMEYIEGAPEFAPGDGMEYARQFASHLARIHRTTCSPDLLPFLYQQAAQPAISPRPARLHAALNEAQIRNALEPRWPPPQHNAPALLHGDYWPGNVLWRDATLVAVVDWEDAAIGDQLYDLAISRLDLCWIFSPQVMERFTQHYCSLQAIDTRSLAHWDLFAALRLIRLAGEDLEQWASFFHPYGRHDITAKSICEHVGAFVGQALETLQ